MAITSQSAFAVSSRSSAQKLNPLIGDDAPDTSARCAQAIDSLGTYVLGMTESHDFDTTALANISSFAAAVSSALRFESEIAAMEVSA